LWNSLIVVILVFIIKITTKTKKNKLKKPVVALFLRKNEKFR